MFKKQAMHNAIAHHQPTDVQPTVPSFIAEHDMGYPLDPFGSAVLVEPHPNFLYIPSHIAGRAAQEAEKCLT